MPLVAGDIVIEDRDLGVRVALRGSPTFRLMVLVQVVTAPPDVWNDLYNMVASDLARGDVSLSTWRGVDPLMVRRVCRAVAMVATYCERVRIRESLRDDTRLVLVNA